MTDTRTFVTDVIDAVAKNKMGTPLAIDLMMDRFSAVHREQDRLAAQVGQYLTQIHDLEAHVETLEQTISDAEMDAYWSGMGEDL